MNLINASSGLQTVHFSLETDKNTSWITSSGLPQWVCLFIRKKGTIIRTVGWGCNLFSSMNPKVVTIHVSTDGLKFKFWDKFRSTSHNGGGDQLFCCAPINSNIYPYIAFEINENFGDKQTCIGRFFLYTDEILVSPESFTTGTNFDNHEDNRTFCRCEGKDTMVKGSSRPTSRSTINQLKQNNDFAFHWNYNTSLILEKGIDSNIVKILSDMTSRVSTLERGLLSVISQLKVKRFLRSLNFDSIDSLLKRKDHIGDTRNLYCEMKRKIPSILTKEPAQSVMIYSEDKTSSGGDTNHFWRKESFISTTGQSIDRDNIVAKDQLLKAAYDTHNLFQGTLNISRFAGSVVTRYPSQTLPQLQRAFYPREYSNLTISRAYF